MGKYFTLAEMVRSTTADRMGINNRLPKELVPNMDALIKNVLDPLREWYGKPIYVNSGYRCEELNRAVKGSMTSDHMRAMAADIDVGSRTKNKILFDYIKANLPFKQLIWEKGNSTGPDWVHVSYDRYNLKKQVLSL